MASPMIVILLKEVGSEGRPIGELTKVLSDDVVLTKRDRGGFRASRKMPSPGQTSDTISPLVPKTAYFNASRIAISHWTMLRTFVGKPGTIAFGHTDEGQKQGQGYQENRSSTDMFIVCHWGEAKPFAVRMWGRFTNYDGEVPTVVCHTLWMVWLPGEKHCRLLHNCVGKELKDLSIK